MGAPEDFASGSNASDDIALPGGIAALTAPSWDHAPAAAASMASIDSRIDSGQLKVAIVGFGYIGVCIGAALAERGLTVVGIDTSEKIVEEIRNGTTSVQEPGLQELVRRMVAAGRLTASTRHDSIENADVIIITVGTPLDGRNKPDLQYIEAAANVVSRHLHNGHLVVLKSTAPPYTTERIVKPILDRAGIATGRYYLAFCPERLAEGGALRELGTVPVIVGGVDEDSTRVVARFWRRALQVRTIEVGSARVAEMTKLADNLWIDLNIALANEIAMLCDKLEIDALEVIDAANTLPKVKNNVNILVPSMGVGGYCLTKDPWFVRHLGEQFDLDLKTPVVSRTINESMPRYTFELIRARLAEHGKKLARSKVAVLGIAFKSDTGDCRCTPAKHTIALLEESGCELAVYDPLVSARDGVQVTARPLASSIEDAIRRADCVAFLTGHAEFKAMPVERIAGLVRPAATILDGRALFTRDQIALMRFLGLDYKGIGR